MTEIQKCEAIIKELMPHLNGDTDRLSEEQCDILFDAQCAIHEGGELGAPLIPGIDLIGMVRTICGMRTLEMVLDEKRINTHQKSVIFGNSQ